MNIEHHHEPPIFELKLNGIFGYYPERLKVNVVKHLGFHEIRFEMFKLEGDKSAMGAKKGQLDAQELGIYEQLMRDGMFVRDIENTIIKRRKFLLLQC